MSALNDIAGDFHVGIRVANGGYVVLASVDDMESPGENIVTTSVFTDVETMCAYVARVCKAMEGPNDAFKKLGPLKVDNA